LPAATDITHHLIYLRVTVPEGVGTDAHDAHVDEFISVEVPDPAIFRPAEISRPPLRQEHLRPFGEEHITPGDNPFCTLPEFLAGAQVQSFVPGQVSVGGEQLWVLLPQGKHLKPGEVAAWVEMLKHLPDDFEVLRLIDGPALA